MSNLLLQCRRRFYPPHAARMQFHPGVDIRSTSRSTPGPTTDRAARRMIVRMTTTDYLTNAVFVLLVLRQVRERRVDLRSFVMPLAIVFFVARNYVHSIPTSGNDLALVAALVGV